MEVDEVLMIDKAHQLKNNFHVGWKKDSGDVVDNGGIVSTILNRTHHGLSSFDPFDPRLVNKLSTPSHADAGCSICFHTDGWVHHPRMQLNGGEENEVILMGKEQLKNIGFDTTTVSTRVVTRTICVTIARSICRVSKLDYDVGGNLKGEVRC